jgi:hypothetical protein
MQFSISAVLFGLLAVSSAATLKIESRQAANGACCIANKSLKQDACTVNGAAGKCVPGGPAACKSKSHTHIDSILTSL